MTSISEEEKLVKLGLRSPNQSQSALSDIKELLQTAIDESWSGFVNEFEGASTSFEEFQSWLESYGIDSVEAANVRNVVETKYASWAEFDTAITSEYQSWQDWENDFASNTVLRSNRVLGSGLSAAGVKLYNEGGVGRAGQNIPAGGVEIYGQQIHLSQTGTPQETPEESAPTGDPITYSNLQVDYTTRQLTNPFTFTADITNNTSFTGSVVPELIVDGVVEDTKTVTLSAGETKTVSFTWYAGLSGYWDVGIGPLDPIEVYAYYGGYYF